MREAFAGVIADYKEFVGTSNILLLFFVSLLALILINNNLTENSESSNERRRLSPTVFLLSLWSAVAYAIVSYFSLIGKNAGDNDKSDKKNNRAVLMAKKCCILLFSIAAIVLSGNSVLSRNAYKASIYYYTDKRITIISVLCIVVYFVIYYLISRQLFNKKGERTLFIITVLMLHLFGFYSEKAAAFSLFLSPVTIQSVIVHDILPIILWLYLMYEEQIKKKLSYDDIGDEVVNETDDDYLEEWDMKKHKILNMRNMAIAFIVLVLAFIASIFVLNKKINTLYDATVVLEKAAKSKMTVCELTDGSGDVILTLMISPDGNTTAIGGGTDSHGQEFYDFISENTDKIDKWYLNDDSDDARGAYDFCVNQGIIVDEVYVISGVERIE